MPRREGPGRLAARNDPWPVDGPPIQGQHKRVGCLSRFASRRAATTGSSSQDGERCSGMRIGRGWPNRTSCSSLQSRSPLTGRRSPATSPYLRCGPLSPNMSDGLADPEANRPGTLGISRSSAIAATCRSPESASPGWLSPSNGRQQNNSRDYLAVNHNRLVVVGQGCTQRPTGSLYRIS